MTTDRLRSTGLSLRPFASGFMIAAGAAGLLGIPGCTSAASSGASAGPGDGADISPGSLSESPGVGPRAAEPGPASLGAAGDSAPSASVPGPGGEVTKVPTAGTATGGGPPGATVSLGSPRPASGPAPAGVRPAGDPSATPIPGQDARPSGPARIDDRLVLARVNGTEIRGNEFNRVYASAWKHATSEGMAMSPEQQQRLMSSALQGMVASELLRQDAVRLGIAPDPKTIDQQFNALRDHAPSPEAFELSLKRSGYTHDSLRAEITNRYLVQVLTNKLRGENSAALLTSEAEAKAFYESRKKSFDRPERVHVRQILRQVASNATAQQMAVERGKIEEAMARLKAGDDFAAVARQYSNDTTAQYGGDMGSFSRGVAIPGFDEVVFVLKPGETSGVFETAVGYHIVQVIEHMPAGIAPFEEVRSLIIEQVTEQKFQQLMNGQLQRLSTTAKIELVQAGAPPASPMPTGPVGTTRPVAASGN